MTTGRSLTRITVDDFVMKLPTETVAVLDRDGHLLGVWTPGGDAESVAFDLVLMRLDEQKVLLDARRRAKPEPVE